jgi:hypothetical protein
MKKRARKQAKASRKVRRGMTNAGSKTRESDEARALLERQLHSLYWWVFNAFKMKGFIGAKALDKLQRLVTAGDESHTERGDFADDDVSPEKRTF